MTMWQSLLNNHAIEQLPIVVEALKNELNNQERDNIIAKALRLINNCTPCLDDMNDEQKTELSNDILRKSI